MSKRNERPFLYHFTPGLSLRAIMKTGLNRGEAVISFSTVTQGISLTSDPEDKAIPGFNGEEGACHV